MSEPELAAYIERCFLHYRSRGYPHQDCRQDARSICEKFKDAATRLSFLGDGDALRFHMHALGFVWSFQRHAIEVRCNGHKTVHEAFADDAFLRKTIAKCLKRSSSFCDNHFRETIRNMAGVQKPSNFRPMAAATVYATISRMIGRKIRVWDMCGGYGGRMMGAFGCSSVSHYKCNEPCSKTADGLREMGETLVKHRGDWSFALSSRPAEDEPIGSYDACFTSPPYFDTERYSEEDSQSCVKYPTYSDWLSGFLRPTLQTARDSLAGDGILAINVAATKRCPRLPEDTLGEAADCGLSLVATWKYLLGATTKGGMKFEPVFVFRKA